jgi:CubicO group peptidase (beta-lactamase class C family)
VLEPVGLDTTDFEVERPVPGHNQVVPGGDEHRRAEGSYPRARRPSGGLWSSVGDLLRFAAHHLGGPGPLGAASVQELQRPVVAGPGFQHGLGWFLRERGGGSSVEHPGSVAGYQSLLLLLPGEGLAFAALTNSSRGGAAIRDLLDRLGVSPPVVDDFPLEPEELAAFAGRYEAPGVRVELAPDGRHLRLQYSEGDPLSREWRTYPAVRLRSVREREFELAEGEWQGQRLGFPRDDVVSFGVAAHRVR